MRVYEAKYNQEFESTLQLARNMPQVKYDSSLVFLCFWRGALNEKHLLSIQSCYITNVRNYLNRKIVLWIQDCPENDFKTQIANYAELRQWDHEEWIERFPAKKQCEVDYNRPSFYSDFVRYSLLYEYGGIWFDLDMLVLRSVDPILATFHKFLCVYAWATEPYPNGAFMMSLQPKDPRLLHIINWFVAKNKGFGFQSTGVKYTDPLDFLVLPYTWFDAGWINASPKICSITDFMTKPNSSITLETLCPGAFMYHWHNQWQVVPHPQSAFRVLEKEIHDLIINK